MRQEILKRSWICSRVQVCRCANMSVCKFFGWVCQNSVVLVCAPDLWQSALFTCSHNSIGQKIKLIGAFRKNLTDYKPLHLLPFEKEKNIHNHPQNHPQRSILHPIPRDPLRIRLSVFQSLTTPSCFSCFLSFVLCFSPAGSPSGSS